MPKKAKFVDLSDLLGEPDLSDLLPPGEQQTERLSPPLHLNLYWTQTTCACGARYESETHAPTTEHKLEKRCGFGWRLHAIIHIPLSPNDPIPDVPAACTWTFARTHACPSCFGVRAKHQDLFPDTRPSFVTSKAGDTMTPNAARWLEMHKCSRPDEVAQTQLDMRKREATIDSLLTFSDKPNLSKYHNYASHLADPEE